MMAAKVPTLEITGNPHSPGRESESFAGMSVYTHIYIYTYIHIYIYIYDVNIYTQIYVVFVYVSVLSVHRHRYIPATQGTFFLMGKGFFGKKKL